MLSFPRGQFRDLEEGLAFGVYSGSKQNESNFILSGSIKHTFEYEIIRNLLDNVTMKL